MPDLEWNYATWNHGHGWQSAGDEWSVAWGGASSQWYGSVLPRIRNCLPARTTLEIAPGHGRWTQFLLRHCERYFGVDISDKCVDVCRRRFAAFANARFIQNDGVSLAMIPDHCVDFVFSYDSLVHVEIDVIREYIWQICAKLSPAGFAYIHHSNAGNSCSVASEAAAGARAGTVSSSIVKELVEDCSGHVVLQEEVNWIGRSRTDCMTLFSLAKPNRPYVLLENDQFIEEMELVRRYQSPYGSV